MPPAYGRLVHRMTLCASGSPEATPWGKRSRRSRQWTRDPRAGPTHANEAPIAAADLRKDRRLIVIVSLRPGRSWRHLGVRTRSPSRRVPYARTSNASKKCDDPSIGNAGRRRGPSNSFERERVRRTPVRVDLSSADRPSKETPRPLGKAPSPAVAGGVQIRHLPGIMRLRPDVIGKRVGNGRNKANAPASLRPM